LCHGTNNRPEKVEKEEKKKGECGGRGTMRNKVLNKYTEERDKKIGREP